MVARYPYLTTLATVHTLWRFYFVAILVLGRLNLAEAIGEDEEVTAEINLDQDQHQVLLLGRELVDHDVDQDPVHLLQDPGKKF